jgi:predicted transcriptional regulator
MVKTELSTLVSRVFDGSVPAMANFLFNSENLSLSEIKSIKSFLDRKESQLKGK